MIAPDLLGHGKSDKPRHDYSLGAHANMLRDLMFALGIERATIVGHSLGGGIGMQLAYQHPMRCERLVLVSSGGLGPEVSWMLRALSLPGVEYLMPLIFPPSPACRCGASASGCTSSGCAPPPRPGVGRLRRAHRTGEPAPVRAHAALGDRRQRPDRQRP